MTQEEVDAINDKEALALIRKKLGTTDLETLKNFLATVPDKGPDPAPKVEMVIDPIPGENPEQVTEPQGEEPKPEEPKEEVPAETEQQ